MTRQQRMMDALTAAFAPTHLEVKDESHKHAGHAGAAPTGETHYHVNIQSEALKGLSRVESHRRIYAALDTEFKNGLHALAIELR